MKVELTRKGSFSCKLGTTNPGRCGNEALTSFGFEVVIRANSTSLDDSDFVLNHFDIPDYFTRTYNDEAVVLSCEMIAMRALVHFHEVMKQRATYIAVNIIADSVSHKATWNGDEDENPLVPKPKGLMTQISKKWTKGEVAA